MATEYMDMAYASIIYVVNTFKTLSFWFWLLIIFVTEKVENVTYTISEKILDTQLNWLLSL